MFAVGKCNFHCFPLLMVGIGTFLFFKIKFFENIECHKCHNTLAVWRNFADVIAFVVYADGFNPLCVVFRKVLFGVKTAELITVCHNSVGKFTSVKCFGIGVCNHLQSFCVVWQFYDIPRLWHAIWHKGFKPFGIFFAAAGACIGIEGTLPHFFKVW